MSTKHTLPSWVQPLDAQEILKQHLEEQSYTHQVFNDYQTAYIHDDIEQYIHIGRTLSDIEDVEYYSNLTFVYDPAYEEVQIHQIKVYRNGSWIDKLEDSKSEVLRREESLNRLIYDGQETLSFILYDIRVDDILVYDFVRKGKNRAFGKYFGYFEYFTRSSDAYRLQLRILLDEHSHQNLEIRYFDTELRFKKQHIERLICYSLLLENPKELQVPKDAPSWYDPWQKALFSNTSSWSEVVDWALSIYHPERYSAGEDIKKIAQECRQYSNDKTAQIVYALHFVQEQIRYFADGSNLGGIIPIDPNESLRIRFADCKNKVVLLKSILNLLDIESYPVLVDTNRGEMLHTYGPSVNSFNHMIIQVWHQGEAYWLDATYTGQSDTLSSITQPDYGYALILRKANDTLTLMPKHQCKNEETLLKSQFDLRSPENTLIVTTVYRGSHADRMRKKTKARKREDLLKHYVTYLQKKYTKLRSTQALHIEDNTTDNILTVTEDYALGNIWEYDEQEDEYSAFFENDELQYAYKIPPKGDRTAPLAMIYPSKVTEVREILLPPAYEEEELTTKKEENRFFSFEKQETYDKTLHQLKQRYTFQAHVPTVLADDLPEYIKRAKEHTYATYRLFSNDPYDISGSYASANLPPEKQTVYISSKQFYDLTDREASLQTETTFYGHEAYRIRKRIQKEGFDPIQKEYLEYYRRYFEKAEVSTSMYSNNLEDTGSITLFESYHLGEIWTKDESDNAYTLYLYNDYLNAAHKIPDEDFNAAYFENRYPSYIIEEREIKLPIDIDISIENHKIENTFFFYEKSESYESETKILKQSYLYHALTRKIPNEVLDEYRKSSNEIEWAGTLRSKNDPYMTGKKRTFLSFLTTLGYWALAWIAIRYLMKSL